MINVENLSKSFSLGEERVTILDSLSLHIPEKSTAAILGKSGSGKSTLLSLLAGLDRPDQGVVNISSHSLFGFNDDELTLFRARTMGIVFQQFHLMSSLTALENVMIPLEILKIENAKEKAMELLEKVGLSHRMHHYPSQLSGGESQRVALARAIIHRPKVIFADEPSGNLDEETGVVVMDLLFDLVQKEGLTLVLVTHDEELAKRCDKTFRLHLGKML
jgi:putative ABC transport system ATP-binding protein